MVGNKPYQSPEGIELKGSTEKSKGQEPKPNRYKGKMTYTNTQCLEIEDNTDFKV